MVLSLRVLSLREPSGGFAPSVHGSNGSGMRKKIGVVRSHRTLCDASEAIAISERAGSTHLDFAKRLRHKIGSTYDHLDSIRKQSAASSSRSSTSLFVHSKPTTIPPRTPLTIPVLREATLA